MEKKQAVKCPRCRKSTRATTNPCGVCDRHSALTTAGYVRHVGSRHTRETCPFRTVTARMYAGRVTISGRIVQTLRDSNGKNMYRVAVETVDGGDWPYPPKVGDQPWVADTHLVNV